MWVLRAFQCAALVEIGIPYLVAMEHPATLQDSQRHGSWVPPCEAWDMMAKRPRWGECWSVPNLDSFTAFFAFYASDDEAQELSHLPVVYHRGALDAIAIRVPIAVQRNGQYITLPQEDCLLFGCERCRSGRGGYQFRWIDDRWTPEAALDMSQLPGELQAEAMLPWPRGILEAPRPRRGPVPFLSSMWDVDVSDTEQ